MISVTVLEINITNYVFKGVIFKLYAELVIDTCGYYICSAISQCIS